jgi:hypothetical protein
VGSDGTVYLSPSGSFTAAGSANALPPGIIAIPPDGSGPRTVVPMDFAEEGGQIWVLGNELYFFDGTLGVVDLAGATPPQTIYQVSGSTPPAPETLWVVEALDATGMYLLESLTSEVQDAGASPLVSMTQWTLLRVPLDGSPPTTLVSFPDIPSASFLESNLLLDDGFVYLINYGGLWSVPKTGGTLTQIRSDVSADNAGGRNASGAARVGGTFFGRADTFTRFTLDPTVPASSIAVLGTGALNHAFPAVLVGDDQGAYGAFTPITPEGLAIAPLPMAAEQTHAIACFEGVEAGTVPVLLTAAAIDPTYIYVVYQLDDLRATVLRAHR